MTKKEHFNEKMEGLRDFASAQFEKGDHILIIAGTEISADRLLSISMLEGHGDQFLAILTQLFADDEPTSKLLRAAAFLAFKDMETEELEKFKTAIDLALVTRPIIK